MSEIIRPGDLVMVVRWPCCGGSVGRIGTVEHLGSPHSRHGCAHCGFIWGRELGQIVQVRNGGALHARPLSWVKRIDPPATGDEVTDRVPLPHELGKVRQRETVK